MMLECKKKNEQKHRTVQVRDILLINYMYLFHCAITCSHFLVNSSLLFFLFLFFFASLRYVTLVESCCTDILLYCLIR